MYQQLFKMYQSDMQLLVSGADPEIFEKGGGSTYWVLLAKGGVPDQFS